MVRPKKKLIHYAGWEPPVRIARTRQIDPERACQLADEGMRAKDIGALMAEEEGRESDYCVETVLSAIRLVRQRNRRASRPAPHRRDE